MVRKEPTYSLIILKLNCRNAATWHIHIHDAEGYETGYSIPCEYFYSSSSSPPAQQSDTDSQSGSQDDMFASSPEPAAAEQKDEALKEIDRIFCPD